MRVVVDTVVWVRALMNRRSSCGQVLARAREYVILMSPETSLELLTVVHRPELQLKLNRFSSRPVTARIMEVLAAAEVVRPSRTKRVCRDPDDDKFFACARAGGADYIVSEDNDVLAISEYEGIRTVSADQFVALLDAQTTP